ncbi:hypothetical protein [Pseudomarimonas arenosa]|uniref:Uncharacterized protein n=1 Tax=Pseudomarimonas arenosa TaxID=2774145 RepID=A0AAW3ZLR7_9GAMM|nr:hypothetical protein [Pseudomarimonas arenosa]MBD8527088.1 hypothetical protein [Pseudomarimonas arenosa]
MDKSSIDVHDPLGSMRVKRIGQKIASTALFEQLHNGQPDAKVAYLSLRDFA